MRADKVCESLHCTYIFIMNSDDVEGDHHVFATIENPLLICQSDVSIDIASFIIIAN